MTLLEERAEVGVVNRANGGEARTNRLVIHAHERVLASHTNKGNMVVNKHDIANLETLVETAGSVGDDDCANAESSHELDADDDILHVPTLVKVEAATHSNNVLAIELAENKLVVVALNLGIREAGNGAVRDDDTVLNVIGEVREASTADDTDFDIKGNLVVNKLDE